MNNWPKTVSLIALFVLVGFVAWLTKSPWSLAGLIFTTDILETDILDLFDNKEKNDE